MSYHNLGIPDVANAFYPSILGAVLIGIAIALFIEYTHKPTGIVGLGLGGAVSINLCGAVILLFWLVSGRLHIPLRGHIILWALALILIVISCFELINYRKRRNPKDELLC
ncbi:hypothetical protein AMJ52_02430 [candidate division TA06 bacterium DG_78]|uniref:Uncharacterized protein n=1 Tax=candidate division TA06 bacterium DG_78 TaxID=1703772 RepID=A0A0S7YGT2_UNCT6|nr:MAG: hypothetical protein AMJ52_02430 [candidate division TA06 bacterium DG_78]